MNIYSTHVFFNCFGNCEIHRYCRLSGWTWSKELDCAELLFLGSEVSSQDTTQVLLPDSFLYTPQAALHCISRWLQFSKAWPVIVWVHWWDYGGFAFVLDDLGEQGILKLQLWQRNASSVTSWALVGVSDPLLSTAFKIWLGNRALETVA